jgi:Protein of unknown function (DUF2934)
MPQKKTKKVPAKSATKRPAKRRTAIPAPMPRTATKPTKMRLVSAAPDAVEPSHDLIAKRAFEIWQTKLRLANDSLRNWLEAEGQLPAELNERNGV